MSIQQLKQVVRIYEVTNLAGALVPVEPFTITVSYTTTQAKSLDRDSIEAKREAHKVALRRKGIKNPGSFDDEDLVDSVQCVREMFKPEGRQPVKA